jgi:hypothetical protein
MDISVIVKVAFGEQAVGKTPVFGGFCMCESAVISVEDTKHSGHQSVSKIG